MRALFTDARFALVCGLAIFSLTFHGWLPSGIAETVRASRSEITLSTYPWAAVKHPYFRGTDKVNIYPYPMLDFLSREKTNRTYRTVMLENDFLRITFLPELGGKIQEVIDKTTGKPMFYVNHVMKPGLIGQCGAWTSGGVEWNTGPQGHTVSAMQPVSVEILPRGNDGSQSIAIGESERIYRTRWTVIVTLRPGRSFIEERIRIYNPTETIRPYYFWNCTAMPNTPGFRFIYPMTLGCDHGAEKFFQWPIDNGKDLTRGTNYYDASSIFAWNCDQDFFGSYDDQADSGVVSYANHNQLPGKKAWTWGQGGFGKMHQMDLTDADGPYNEVQTGPLLTQGEVGRLDPCEAVSWEEWWYPIHGIGGFTFANKDVAVNASLAEGTELRLSVLGTATFKNVEVVFEGESAGRPSAGPNRLTISPLKPAALKVEVPASARRAGSIRVALKSDARVLARFHVPLSLPERTRPAKRPAPSTASELSQRGWEHFLFARFDEAESHFRRALKQDSNSVDALTGLAFLQLDSAPEKAVQFAQQAQSADPDCGLAHYALAIAQSRTGEFVEALENSWKASLDPATAAAGRALAGKLLIRQGEFGKAVLALSGPGPWQADPLCRDLLALSLQGAGHSKEAVTVALQTLETEPLDLMARTVLWLAKSEQKGITLRDIANHNEFAIPDLVADFADAGLAQPKIRADLLKAFKLGGTSDLIKGHFPYRFEFIPELEANLRKNPRDGRSAFYLGHLLFHAGRHHEACSMWERAVEAGVEPVIAYRALGMASLNVDHDPAAARSFLEKAHGRDPLDPIVARDLARVLFAQADKLDDRSAKEELLAHARDTLSHAFGGGKGRSDFVALLGRAHNRLGEFSETARMLDSVRVTVWEGSHEVHDLFEESHLEIGKQFLASNRPADALREFDRALEYPDNLATGKLENTREAHVNYLRGEAFKSMGRKDQAVQAWKRAVDEEKSSDPKKEEARQKAREALSRQ